MAKCVAMVSCYANFGLGKYFGGVPKCLLRDCDQNTRAVWLCFVRIRGVEDPEGVELGCPCLCLGVVASSTPESSQVPPESSWQLNRLIRT